MPELVSLIVPIFNEEDCLPMLRSALAALADRLGEQGLRTEIVLVDDGSTDASWRGILEFAHADARVRAVSFSRNFGHQPALTCGYQIARGDAVVTLDADLQDPPEVVLDLVAAWRQGADVVYAMREEREGENWFKRRSADAFYRLFRAIAESPAPADVGDFRLMSRRAVDALNQLHEVHRYIRGMVGWIGFKTATVRYRRRPRAAGRTKYPLIRMMRLAVRAIFSFSVFPLRLFYWAALLSMIPFMLYAAVALVRWGILGVPTRPSWLSLQLSIIAFGCLHLVCLGILGEYVGRIYEQAQARPLYLIRERLNLDDDVRSSATG